LLAEKEKLEAEVADLEAQKRTLEATLAKDAEVNAGQIAKITELTVHCRFAHLFFSFFSSLAFYGGNI